MRQGVAKSLGLCARLDQLDSLPAGKSRALDCVREILRKSKAVSLNPRDMARAIALYDYAKHRSDLTWLRGEGSALKKYVKFCEAIRGARSYLEEGSIRSHRDCDRAISHVDMITYRITNNECDGGLTLTDEARKLLGTMRAQVRRTALPFAIKEAQRVAEIGDEGIYTAVHTCMLYARGGEVLTSRLADELAQLQKKGLTKATQLAWEQICELMGSANKIPLENMRALIKNYRDVAAEAGVEVDQSLRSIEQLVGITSKGSVVA